MTSQTFQICANNSDLNDADLPLITYTCQNKFKQIKALDYLTENQAFSSLNEIKKLPGFMLNYDKNLVAKSKTNDFYILF